jgi:hypothetical protein
MMAAVTNPSGKTRAIIMGILRMVGGEGLRVLFARFRVAGLPLVRRRLRTSSSVERSVILFAGPSQYSGGLDLGPSLELGWLQPSCRGC